MEGPLEALGLAFCSSITRREEAFALSNTWKKIQSKNSGYIVVIPILGAQCWGKDTMFIQTGHVYVSRLWVIQSMVLSALLQTVINVE